MQRDSPWREYLEPDEMEQVAKLDQRRSELKTDLEHVTDAMNRLRNRCFGRMRLKREKTVAPRGPDV